MKSLLSFYLPLSGLLPEPLISLGDCRDHSPVQSRGSEDQMGGHTARDQNRYGMGEDNRLREAGTNVVEGLREGFPEKLS